MSDNVSVSVYEWPDTHAAWKLEGSNVAHYFLQNSYRGSLQIENNPK